MQILERMRASALAAAAAVALAACGPATDAEPQVAAAADAPAAVEIESAPPAPAGPASAAASPEVAADAGPAGAAASLERRTTEQAWTPFATVGGIVLHHPSARVEAVGFHESNHDGARQLEPLDSAVSPLVLETRERGTGSRSAADVVVDPLVEVRAPVTGTVKRAGTYVLYCEHQDDYAVIAPDANPSWEVKVLHIDGVRVAAGDRVEAGVTVLAGGPTPLPFRSQVDDLTAEPSWPHVHLEVVDPSIPDRPSSGSDC